MCSKGSGDNCFTEQPIWSLSLSIDITLIVKNDSDNVLVNQSFKGEFSYDVQSDKFGMEEYEDNIADNLNGKISNDIIVLLGTLK